MSIHRMYFIKKKLSAVFCIFSILLLVVPSFFLLSICLVDLLPVALRPGTVLRFDDSNQCVVQECVLLSVGAFM